ncbi:MAG: IS30 family transposase [Candidatus Omnitrophica bacterium]|nr:IS30 family transposase [Candidatus Omnitrophota bacterium]
MKKQYKQLTSDERDLIAIHYANGFNISDIAKMLNRNKSTISRELTRNSSKSSKVYLSQQAQKRAQKRKQQAAMKEELKCHKIRNFVKNKLKIGWTPEIIAGELALDSKNLNISHESIYLYIYKKRPDLVQYLARSHKKRFKRVPKSNKKNNRIPNRVSIDQRPQEINDRSEFGHWESDAIVSKQSKVSLAVSIERISKLVKIKKIKQNKANLFSRAIIRRMKPLPPYARRSFTYDNGSENVLHEFINDELNSDSYFCNPYHSWEKGSVENVNGLIRRFLPKKTDFAKITHKRIKEIEFLLNNRPRKCLGFKTPVQVFLEQSVALAN